MINNNKKSKVVCILGMHRSGTSMVTRILNICGVYLGKKNDLMIGYEDNKKGHWENEKVVQINDEILRVFGGAWNKMPRFPKNWQNDKKLDHIYKKAQKFINEMNSYNIIWGFKDPRTCLTIPFWEKILPNMKYVILYRSPIDIASSLYKRNGIDIADSLLLSLSYWNLILKHTSGRKKCFTYFDNYFINWQKEIEKVLHYLNIKILKLDNDKKNAIEEFITIDLRHNNIGSEKKIDFKNITHENIVQLITNAFVNRNVKIDKKFYVQDNKIKNLNQIIQQKDQEINNLNQTFQQKNEELKRLSQIIKKKDNEIKQMQSSKFWKLREMHFKIKFVIFHPLNFFKKYKFKIKFIFKSVIYSIQKEGFKIMFKRSLNYIRHGKGFLEELSYKKEDLYKKWINHNEKLLNDNLYENIDNKFKELNYKSKISIIMPVYNSDEIFLKKAIFSVIYQYYQNWELIIINDCSTKKNVQDILREFSERDKRIRVFELNKNSGISIATNFGVNKATGEYIGFLDHDDELVRQALFEVAKIIGERGNKPVDFIYSDDDKIDENGYRYDPQFKPDWSPELLLSYCYISHFKVVKKNIFLKLGGFRNKFDGAQDYDFLLRLAEVTNKVFHIPKILYHWRATQGSIALSSTEKPESIKKGKDAVQECLDRRGIKGVVSIPTFANKENVGIYEIKFNIDDYKEKVTIIIPTKDQVELLKKCIDSIQEKTRYLNYEIFVINNNSNERKTVQYLKKRKIKFIDINNGKFNFSYINNEAVKLVNSELILFLNNDTEVISEDWLLNLVGTLSMNNKIGAVGAKLLYSDKRIQHAGVIIGLNDMSAGHANKLLRNEDVGYLHYACVMRNYSAVTAACLLTKKSIFKEIDGFDEKKLAVSYNDVDYCLKLIRRKYRIVYNPNSILYHHEGKTRGFGDNIDELNYFKDKWKDYAINDPYYNPNLSIKDEKFTIKYE